jgi:AcrR family transcriptional regulator
MAKRKRSDNSALLVATIRSPAADLGPRATRMIARILAAARTVFLAKGYSGTTIDEIARTAGISRASFYTYFPTKRDVLLALGADSADRAEATARRFAAEHRGRRLADLTALVDEYFALLEEHGAFATAWAQAAQEDDDIRAAGMRRHLRLCADLGVVLGAAGSNSEAAIRGLAAYSLVERAWSFAHLYDGDIDVDAFKVEVARVLHASMAGTRIKGAAGGQPAHSANRSSVVVSRATKPRA